MATGIESLIHEAIDRIFQITGKHIALKDEQKEAVTSLLSGRDVLAILPTGFGKTLIFQLFAIAKSVQSTRDNTSSSGSVLVICPLDSIVKDQITEAESYGLKAVSLNSSESEMSEQMKAVPDVVFSSAEAVSQKAFRDSLKTGHVHAIVVDESHTAETWTGKR